MTFETDFQPRTIIFIVEFITSMHFSMMCTARLLTVSRSIPQEGGGSASGGGGGACMGVCMAGLHPGGLHLDGGGYAWGCAWQVCIWRGSASGGDWADPRPPCEQNDRQV